MDCYVRRVRERKSYASGERRHRPDDKAFIRSSVREALYERRQDSIDYRILRPNGDARVVHTRVEFVRGEAGKPIGLIGTVQDVTERRRAEEELRSSRDQLEIILRGMTDGVTAQDPSGRLVYANEAAARIVGYASAAELLEARDRC